MSKVNKRKSTKPKALPPRWNTVPILRMALAFIGGIIFEIFTESDYPILSIAAIIFFGAIVILTYYRKITSSYKYRWLFGISLTIAFFFSGALVTYLQSEKNYPLHFSKFIKPANIYIVRLTEPIVEKASSVKLITEVTGYYDSAGFHNSKGHLLVYLQKDSTALQLKYGQVLLFTGTLQSIREPANPGEFNYKQFLYFHQIFQQVYLRSNQWKLTNVHDGHWIFDKSYSLRDNLVSVLKKYIETKREYAVASALTVGYEDDLDQELIQAYASSGALHVLSVSGMHVGLIYVVLAWLLSFLDNIKRGRHLKYILLLSFLWFYAVLTGMSPSVMRSAAMLTFVIFGQWSKKQNMIYNTLAVSFFGLLCYDPFYITEVGFQLSYLAVFGIVFIHPLMFKWYEPNSKFMSEVWTITSVSLAAQTATFPLGLLYFHQFPLMFIISNLIVIPLSSLVIFGGIALLLFSYFDGFLFVKVILFYLSKALFGVIWLINKVVLLVDEFNYSVINGISITVLETWIIYLLLFFVIGFLVQKRTMFLHLSLVCIVIILSSQLFEMWKIRNQKQLIVYTIKNHSAINFIDGENNHFITDTVLRQDRSAMLFHVMHHWWECGVYDWEYSKAFAGAGLKSNSKNYYHQSNFIQFYDKRILLVDSLMNTNVFIGETKTKFDYAIVSSNATRSLKNLIQNFQIKQIIIDSSNNYKSIKKIKSLCTQNKIPFYDVNEQGAFILNM
ncbi:MAG: ComEC/Rec2 family competence protein [Bacteroidia bacterium]